MNLDRRGQRLPRYSNLWKTGRARFPVIGKRGGLLLAAAMLLAGTAQAIDPPHYIVVNGGDICSACHMTHNALGGNLGKADTVGNLCMSCHTPGGLANNKSFGPGDQAVHWLTLGTNSAASGNSHRWDSSFAGRLVYLGGAPTSSAGKITQSGVYGGAYTKIFTITISTPGPVGTAQFNWSANMNGGGGANIPTSASVTNLGDGIVLSFTDGATNLTSFAVNDQWQLIVRNDTSWPTNPAVTYVLTNGGGGMVTCSTCHDEKNQILQPFDTNAPAYGGAGTGQGRHFMRADNDRHQLCNDCHRSRVVTNSMFGSHPVGIPVTTGLYYKAATNLVFEPGTTNIVCMTCHQVHYASTSDGSLLRATNGNDFCNSCHQNANLASAHFNTSSYLTLWPGGQYGSLFPAHSNAADRGTCANCHFVHGWPDASNPTSRYPRLTVETEENLCLTCHDNDGPSMKNVKDDFAKSIRHPLSDKDALRRHGRSVECLDCHNPHVAQSDVHNYTNIANAARGLVSGSLKGVSGVYVNYTGLGNFAPISTDRYAIVTQDVGATNEYQICFKCHTGYNLAGDASGTASFTTNSATVTGSGTSWTTNLVGMWLSRSNDATCYVITGVADANTLTITPAYRSATGVSQPYMIRDLPPGLTPIAANGTATFTANSTTITGSGTAWNAGMVGAWIYPASSTGVAYKIVQYVSTTSIRIAPAYTGATASGQSYIISAETDVAQEFSPMNRSGHPIVTGLDNYPNSTVVGGRRGLLAAAMKSPWTNIGVQVMMCSDCHNTDSSGSLAAQGPHGSASQYMLRGPNAANWPNAQLSQIATNWCMNCHNNSAGQGHSNGNHNSSSIKCYTCHIVVPHGGKMSRLINCNNGNMPARYAYSNNVSNVGFQSFLKAATGSYSENGNCKTSCGHHSGGPVNEVW